MKSVRFASVVAQCGAPLLHVSWVPVAKDAALQQAVRQQRVMTLHQMMRGGRKDFGTIGLHHDDETRQLLIFPKSLRAFAGRKVVAIDYTLLGEEKHPAGGAVDLSKSRPAPIEREKPAPTLKVVDEPVRDRAAESESDPRPTADRVTPKRGMSHAKARAGSRHGAARLTAPAAAGRDKDRAASRPEAGTLVQEILAEVEAAADELKKGRQVAAYERLKTLLEKRGRKS